MRFDFHFWGQERWAIAALAAQLRESARLRSPPYSTAQLIARCCPRVLVTGDRLWPGTLGLTRVDGDRVLIAYRRGLGDGRQREVIGHELGHLFLDRLQPGEERRCLAGGPRNHRLIDFTIAPTAEARCDYFGDELFVPLVRLADDVGGARLFPPRREAATWTAFENLVDRLAGRYKVTKACIRRRLRLLSDVDGPVLIPRGRGMRKAG